MPRDLSSALYNELGKQALVPVFLVDIQFTSGWVYLFTGNGILNWNGHTYLGVVTPQGQMLGMISSLIETSDVQAQNVTVSLSGIPSTAVQQVLQECRESNGCRIYLGALQSNGALIADPFCAWGGTTDIPTITADGSTCTVSITIESRLVDLQRSCEWRYTHEDQQLFSPGDLGFAFVAALQDLTVSLNGASVSPVGQAPIPTGG